MKYYVYVLRSQKSKRLYIGSSQNVQRRLMGHNSGVTVSTKPFRPWEIVHIEEFTTKHAALQREKQLKSSGVARAELKRNPKEYMPPSSIG